MSIRNRFRFDWPTQGRHGVDLASHRCGGTLTRRRRIIVRSRARAPCGWVRRRCAEVPQREVPVPPRAQRARARAAPSVPRAHTCHPRRRRAARVGNSRLPMALVHLMGLGLLHRSSTEEMVEVATSPPNLFPPPWVNAGARFWRSRARASAQSWAGFRGISGGSLQEVDQAVRP